MGYFSAVIVTSATSCGNSFVFVAVRAIHALARQGQAPKFLGYTTKRGVPLTALLFVLGICCLSYMSMWVMFVKEALSLTIFYSCE